MTRRRLTTEAVEGSALALEGIDYVEGGNRLAFGVLSVSDSIADDLLESVSHGSDGHENESTYTFQKRL